MMSNRQLKNTDHNKKHYGAGREGVLGANVKLMRGHSTCLGNARENTKRSQPADVVSFNREVLSGDGKAVKPRLPNSIRVSQFTDEQVRYIEQLGWVLVYLFKRYPELKQTQGFNHEHIKTAEHVLRKGFYETHVYSTIDVGNAPQKVTIDVVCGRFDAEHSSWSVEIFADGGLVRKHICKTEDQVVAMLDQQLHKYGLIQLAWERARAAR
ncbi:hypothetical protein [Alkalimarinus coralli]|uniref:hypothetical protein n=1 Tax=Alkalimarinus coralli TaxID=2935863 RepID=UPI00202B2A19|nr:hypothetical protein [Alkalimarinus coralli]